MKHLFADGAHDRLKLLDEASYLDLVIEINRRSDDRKGLRALPRRWMVERNFGWITAAGVSTLWAAVCYAEMPVDEFSIRLINVI